MGVQFCLGIHLGQVRRRQLDGPFFWIRRQCNEPLCGDGECVLVTISRHRHIPDFNGGDTVFVLRSPCFDFFQLLLKRGGQLLFVRNALYRGSVRFGSADEKPYFVLPCGAGPNVHLRFERREPAQPGIIGACRRSAILLHRRNGSGAVGQGSGVRPFDVKITRVIGRQGPGGNLVPHHADIINIAVFPASVGERHDDRIDRAVDNDRKAVG